MDTCWTILRFFGYDNQLYIKQELWDDHTISDVELERARCFELKKGAIDFLGSLYRADSQVNAFDQQSVERVFQSSPFECPWQIQKETLFESAKIGQPDNQKIGISIENWIGLWLKHFNTDPKLAFRDLIYVGYCGQMKDAIMPIHARPRDVSGVPHARKCFTALVIGAQNSGKSSFIRSFIEAPYQE